MKILWPMLRKTLVWIEQGLVLQEKSSVEGIAPWFICSLFAIS